MAYSYNEVGAKSPGDTIPVTFGFLDREHVTVKVDNVVTTNWSWINNGLISCDTGFPSGAKTRVFRTTPVTPLSATLNGASVFDWEGVNMNDLQVLYIQQESKDAEAERQAQLADLGAALDAVSDDVELAATSAFNAANSATTASQASTTSQQHRDAADAAASAAAASAAEASATVSTKVTKAGDRMTGELELYTSEDASQVTQVQGRMLPKLGQYISYIAGRTYTAVSTFFSQPLATLEAAEAHSGTARGTKGSLWATAVGTGTTSRRLTWDDTGIRGLIAGTTMDHLLTSPVAWGASESSAAAVNDAVFTKMLAQIGSGRRIDGQYMIYPVSSMPDISRFKRIAFKVGSIIYGSRDFWRGVTTSKISNSLLYTAWAQDKAYRIENQIRVWGMEKESHTDGTERIVLYTSDDNGASFAPAEYLTPEADGRSVWSAGIWGNDEVLIVRVGAGGLDVAPFTYEKWHRTFNFGAGTSDYNKPWTVTPITFPVPAGFSGQPSMVHSWTIGHGNSIVVGAHWGAGAAVMRSTDGGVTWTDHVIATGTANEEPTVRYDATTQRYYGFLRNGSSGGNPKWWHSGVNDLSSASINVYTAPAGTFGPVGMQSSPMPFEIVDGRVYAFGSYRSGNLEGAADDELTSAYFLDLPLTAGNIWSQVTSKIFHLGTIPHREVGGASACGVGSVVLVDDKLHLFFGMEERTGTTNGFNRIANLYQTVIPLRERTGIYDFRHTLADNRASGSPLRKLPGNAGYVIYTDDGAGNEPARVGGCPNFSRHASTLTIASGVLTITAKHGYYVIDTEGAAAADDLDKISVAGRLVGDCIILQTASSGRDVTVKHNSIAGAEGSIHLNGITDKLLSAGADNIILTLALSGSTKIWKQLSFNDLAA